MYVEGCTIAVSVTRTLPAQPAVGVVNYVPLGGDGFSAPFAAYAVAGFNLQGTAGGGQAKITLQMDPRFVSLIAYVTGSIDQDVAADAELGFFISGSAGHVPIQRWQATVSAVSLDTSTTPIATTWSPNPMLLPGGNQAASTLVMTAVNVDAFTYNLSTFIYLFNIRVREVSPMGPLLFARGASAGAAPN